MRFAFSYNRFNRVLLTVLFAGPRRAFVELTTTDLVVRQAIWFRATVPRASIVEAKRLSARYISSGAHGWGGRWLVNASSQGLVVLSIEPVGRARVIGFPVTLRQLTLSLEEPEAFLAAVNGGPSEVTSRR